VRGTYSTRDLGGLEFWRETITTGRALAAIPRSANQISPGWRLIEQQVEDLLFGDESADYAASFPGANLDQRPIPQSSGPRGRIRIRHNPGFGIAPAFAGMSEGTWTRSSFCWDTSPSKRLRSTLAVNNAFKTRLTTGSASSPTAEHTQAGDRTARGPVVGQIGRTVCKMRQVYRITEQLVQL